MGVFSNPRLFPADPRLPAAPEVTPDISASASNTSSLRGSPKLTSLRESAPSGSPAPVKPAYGLSTGSTHSCPKSLALVCLDLTENLKMHLRKQQVRESM